MPRSSKHDGIWERRGKDGTRSFKVRVRDPRTGDRVGGTHATLAAAKGERDDLRQAKRKGTLAPACSNTVAEEVEAWLTLAEAGQVDGRGHRPYRRNTLTQYRGNLRLFVLPRIGHLRVDKLTRHHVQEMVDELRAGKPVTRQKFGEGFCGCGCGAKTEIATKTVAARGVVRGQPMRFVAGHKSPVPLNPGRLGVILSPLKAFCAYAHRRGMFGTNGINPCADVSVPAPYGRRREFSDAEETERLLVALPEQRDRTAWAIAFYGGLRIGEIRALRVSDIDFDALDGRGMIRVRRSWVYRDDERNEGKTAAARRDVPMVSLLRGEILTLMAERNPADNDLLVGNSPNDPLRDGSLRTRSRRIWQEAGLLDDERQVSPHVARHTFRTFMRAAGVHPYAEKVIFGHSLTDISDQYGGLPPAMLADARDRVETYLRPSDGAVIEGTGDEILELPA